MAMISAISAATPARGRKNSPATSSASSATAVPSRLRESGNVGALRLLQLLAGAAEAPLAPAVRGERFFERRGIEVGPQRLGEVELGVGELPQQEVADALLAAGADEEVRLGRVAHGEIRSEHFFPDLPHGGI